MHNALSTIQNPRDLCFRYNADPFDLRPVVKKIMDMENMILDRLPPDQKLVILVGEYHMNMTHILLIQAVIQAHKQVPHRFALGLELPHDNIDFIDVLMETETLTNEKPHIINAMDSYNALFKFCRTQEIDVRFNDLARTDDFRMDADDEMTANIIRKHGLPRDVSPHECPIDTRTILGMKLRNIGIVENAISHIKKSDARIYIQHCGENHVFGSKLRLENYPYEESLTSLFHQHGFAVLAVSLKDKFAVPGPYKWPHDALKDVSDVIVPLDMDDGHALDFKYDVLRQRVNAASGYDL